MKQKAGTVSLIVSSLLIGALPARAADCTFATAINSQPETKFELRLRQRAFSCPTLAGRCATPA